MRKRLKRKRANHRRKLTTEQLEDRRVLATFMVTSNADSGEGSLRSAIELSNTTPGADEIHFSLPTGQLRIAPTTVLPWLLDSVTLDGTTQPGFSQLPIVELSGENITEVRTGINVNADNVQVRGFVINQFTNSGIFVHQVSGTVIQSNIIGADATGEVAKPNGTGIAMSGASDATIGGGSPELGNLVSGNTGYGIVVFGSGATNNRIQGNIVGADIGGTKAIANGFSGVFLDDEADGNVVGTDSDGLQDDTEGNLISGNGLHGVIVRNASSNVIAGNCIGTDVDGLAPIGNVQRGIQLVAANANRVGGSQPFERNVISGNGRAGIHMDGATSSTIAGNFIGVASDGSTPLGNNEYGIMVRDESNSNTIGTNGDGVDDAGERNVIAGNRYAGIYTLDAHFNTIAGNYIGVDVDGTHRVANNVGINLTSGSTGNIVGTNADGVSDDLEKNVISGNVRNGLEISDSYSSHVAGNWIGLGSDGVPIPNRRSGVWVYSEASGNQIGGGLESQRNVISGNWYQGVAINSTGNSVLGNYIGTSVDGLQPIGNQREAVLIYDAATGNSIGDGTQEGRNVISGGSADGIHIRNADGNSVTGNWIGVAADGETPLGNAGIGIRLTDSNQNTVGIDTREHAGLPSSNVLMRNVGGGIYVQRSSSNRIARNQLGFNGRQSLDDEGQSIHLVDSSDNILGGPTPTGFNEINSRSAAAITIAGDSLRNELAGALVNSSHATPIDLGGDDATPNDALDVDVGPNGLMNSPEILSVLTVGRSSVVIGVIATAANTQVDVDVYFASPQQPHQSVFLQRVESVQVGPDGIGAWQTSLSTTSGIYRAVARQQASGSSEFSMTVSTVGRLGLVLDQAAAVETAGQIRATVGRGDVPMSESMVVSLSSTDAQRVLVPEQVTIPAGQESVGFTVTLVNDSLAQPTLDVAIIAKSAGELASGAAILRILRSDVWHNDIMPLDVNDDSQVAPNDVLAIVNAINSGLAGDLAEQLAPDGARFVDTNNDGFLSPIDALIVINELNRTVGSEGEFIADAGLSDEAFDLSWVDDLKKNARGNLGS